eukprot:3735180-Rhodomonas_salina.1
MRVPTGVVGHDFKACVSIVGRVFERRTRHPGTMAPKEHSSSIRPHLPLSSPDHFCSASSYTRLSRVSSAFLAPRPTKLLLDSNSSSECLQLRKRDYENH